MAIQQSAVSKQFPIILDRTVLLAMLGIPLIHLCLANISLLISFQDGTSAIWPSAGVYLAAVLRFGFRIWPILLLSELVFNIPLYNNIWASLLISGVNIIDPIVIAVSIRYWIGKKHLLARTQNVFKFIVLLIVSPVMTTTFAIAVLCLTNITPWESFADTWRTWFVAMFVGHLIGTPTLLAWTEKNTEQKRSRQRVVEPMLLSCLTIATLYIAFWLSYSVEYMFIPLLMWSAFRFSQRQSTALVTVIAAIAILRTSAGFGSFVRESASEVLLLLQSFIGVIAVSTFVLLAMISENRASAKRLRKSNEELEQRVEERTAEFKAAKEEAEAAKLLADEANQAKSDFLANMSHELRTPLNAVLGYSQILLREKDLSSKQRDGLNIIQQSSSHLLALITDLLDLTKIEARKLELYTTDFHFTYFLDEVREICRIRAEQKEIIFTYQARTPLPLAIHADGKRLRQVLLNLLSNSIKFTDIGNVTLIVGTVSNAEHKGAKNAHSQRPIVTVKFQIVDTGIGMTPEQLKKIFLPFEQVGDRSRKAEGTGLGLSISRQIVQMMGGDLKVESTFGQGTRFWFEVNLPIAVDWQTSEQHQLSSTIIGYQGQERTILVVDDSWENRSVIVNLLEPLGFRVIDAENGQEGLEQAQRYKPDLIITDLAMPVMDGFEMTKQLRQSPTLADIIILASSASILNFYQQQSKEVGCNDFLSKPIHTEDLFAQLQQHLKLIWICPPQQVPSAQTQEKAIAVETEWIIPPSHELVALYKATQHCYVADVQIEIDRIRQLSPQYQMFTDRLLMFSKEFEIEAIAQLIEPHI
jgi:signal transduction histidine kinase/FixJ family two-component response regulator